MFDRIKEDTADRIGVTAFCLIMLLYVLFWVGVAVCVLKLMWWIIFVL